MSNSRAILLMVASMAAFAGVDACIKLASSGQSSAQILAVTSLAMFLVFWLVLAWRREPLFARLALHPAMVVRTAGEAVGSTGIVLALAMVPLSTVAMLGQAMPLAVTLGAALFLGERVGWRRWSAVGAGFAGVLVILRPGLDGFEPAVLWVVLYIFGLATRDIASRALPRSISTPFAVAWSMLVLGLFGLVLMPFQGGWHPVDAGNALGLFGVVVLASAALALVTVAMRTGEISAVAPFRYSRIVFALAIAYAAFGEVPDRMTWAGAALIIGSGSYAYWRERVVSRPVRA